MVSDRFLEVYLDGALCGRITQISSGNLTFEYERNYRTDSHATPLSLSMPLAATVHKKRSILPFLQGLLPDNDEALRAIARRFSVSPRNPFALLEHVGADVAGAVQIVRPGHAVTDHDQRRTSARAASDDEVSRMLDHVVTEYAEGVPYIDAVGRFSLAGAQPKIALHRLADGRWGVPMDATPTTHILKPVVGSFRRIDIVEQMTMHAAAYLDNTVAKSEVVRIGDWDVFVSERYDRAVIDGTWRRLHQEDLCQALSVSPVMKYQHREGGPGIADIAGLIRSLPFESDRRLVGEQFYRGFVFNIVAGCTDAHAKNYSLMLDGAAVKLAPLYDLATYAAYWDGQSSIESAMSVGGEYRFSRIGAADLGAAGKQFGVPADAADGLVQDARLRVVEAFESAYSAVESGDASVRDVAAAVIRGVRNLPLVI